MSARFPSLFVVLLLQQASLAHAGVRFVVTNSEPELLRNRETIVVPWTFVESEVPGSTPERLTIVDVASGETVAHQFVEAWPEGGYSLILQTDFVRGPAAAGSLWKPDPVLGLTRDFPEWAKKSFIFSNSSSNPPQRFLLDAASSSDDDNFFYWENDLVTFRLSQSASARSPGSGIDAVGKQRGTSVIKRSGGRLTFPSGSDAEPTLLTSASSRGCGGSGIWLEGKLYAAPYVESVKVESNGPIRLELSVTMAPYFVGMTKVHERKRIRIDTGQPLFFVSTSVEFSGAPLMSEALFAIGLAKGAHESLKSDTRTGVVSIMARYGRNMSTLGGAIVLDKRSQHRIAQLAEDEVNRYVLVRMKSGEKVCHFAGAALIGDKGSMSQHEWHDYVFDWSVRIRSPALLYSESFLSNPGKRQNPYLGRP